MAKYTNRIKRKRFFKKMKNNFVSFITATTTETECITTLDRVIWKDIKEGLDYGMDIRYTLFDNEDFMPSLENEYNQYFGKVGTELELNVLFTALTTELLPTYICKYTDLDLIVGECPSGKYFEITFK